MKAFFKQKFVSRHRDQQQAFAQLVLAEAAPGNGAIQLKKHQHLHVHDACGWAVHAMAGTVWITQDGDLRDIVLEAGQSFVLDSEHNAILSPLNEAQLVVERGPCRKAAQTRTRKAWRSFAYPAAHAVSV